MFVALLPLGVIKDNNNNNTVLASTTQTEI